ncbi:MAG TPA: hypothetical protein VHP13_05205 [Gammaproteobacteria bacterium]|jgi:hypothetical protein|nr:hypothetical protein [Gammaproteobacteria bacterium]
MIQADPKARSARRAALSPQDLAARWRPGAGSNHGGWRDPKATGLVGGANLYLRGLWQRWLSHPSAAREVRG